MNKLSQLSWRESLLLYKHPKVLAMLLLGFSAGLPYLLVFSTLTAWLNEEGVSKTGIGFFAWVGITYSVKVLWAPVVDRMKLPWLTAKLGQRRSWMLLAQVGVALGIFSMSVIDPKNGLTLIALSAVLVAFSSATQDIALDAFRIEAVQSEYQGAMAATYIFGYRVALLVAGAGALYIAEYGSWSVAYQSMAALMTVGMLTVLLVSEPNKGKDNVAQEMEESLHKRLRLKDTDKYQRLAVWFASAVISPFVDFFRRNGKFALMILAFIGLFRISDIIMGIMANPFYLDLGFSKTEIANVAKIFGFGMTILGAALGGLFVARYGLFRPLIIGAILVAATNLLFAVMAGKGADLNWLMLVISADNLSGGFSGGVFIAYLSSLTNRAYTATQYALFSSFMTLPGKFISGFSGMVVDASGYAYFFSYAAAMGVPAIFLSILIWRHSQKTDAISVCRSS